MTHVNRPSIFVFAALWVVSGPGGARLAAGDTGHGPPGKRALLVGIDNYKYPDKIPSLAGSINDVEDMRAVLIGKFEFPAENITVLKDAEATHAGIISAIRTQLIAKAQPGDIVVFHYSGHGSQMPDKTKKMIGGVDETIVPYDSRDDAGKVFDISGAELHGLLLQLAAKTRNITFILDSCHSGTLVRGARVRGIIADERQPPPPPSYAVETRGLGQIEGSSGLQYAFIAAATSRESAFEHFSEGKVHGALTYFLTRQLRAAKAAATYRDIMDSVIGNVTSNYPSQHPSLEGVEADQYVFGDGSSLAEAYVTASPLGPDDTNKVSIGEGQVQGATVGSTYDVYPPGARKLSPPAKPVATVLLTSVGAFTSEGKIVSGAPIAASSRAVERMHWFGDSKLRVFMDGLDKSPTLQSIKMAFDALRYVEVVDRPTACNMQVRQERSMIETLAADAAPLSPPVAIGDPQVVDRVVGQIQLWAKWFNALTIRNPHSEIDLQFSIKASETRDPMARVGRPDAGIFEGETVETVVKNNSAKDLYIAMIDLEIDGQITRMYPDTAGAFEVLKPGTTLLRRFTGTVPDGRSISTDIVKVFASYQPIDLTPLVQGAIREIPRDPLSELLMDAGGGSRGLAPVLAKPVDLRGWTATQRVVVVKRKK